MEKKVGWLRAVVLLGGMEERPLFPFMMLIAYRHPLTVSSQPYCKSTTRQTATGNTLPPIPVCRKPQHLMPHAQNNVSFRLSLTLCAREYTGVITRCNKPTTATRRTPTTKKQGNCSERRHRRCVVYSVWVHGNAQCGLILHCPKALRVLQTPASTTQYATIISITGGPTHCSYHTSSDSWHSLFMNQLRSVNMCSGNWGYKDVDAVIGMS